MVREKDLDQRVVRQEMPATDPLSPVSPSPGPSIGHSLLKFTDLHPSD